MKIDTSKGAFVGTMRQCVDWHRRTRGDGAALTLNCGVVVDVARESTMAEFLTHCLIDTISGPQIDGLRREAQSAGDAVMVEICDLTIAGDGIALLSVCDVIVEAANQADEFDDLAATIDRGPGVDC